MTVASEEPREQGAVLTPTAAVQAVLSCGGLQAGTSVGYYICSITRMWCTQSQI